MGKNVGDGKAGSGRPTMGRSEGLWSTASNARLEVGTTRREREIATSPITYYKINIFATPT